MRRNFTVQYRSCDCERIRYTRVLHHLTTHTDLACGRILSVANTRRLQIKRRYDRVNVPAHLSRGWAWRLRLILVRPLERILRRDLDLPGIIRPINRDQLIE